MSFQKNTQIFWFKNKLSFSVSNTALKSSPSKKRCNSIAALKATSQEFVSAVSQDWKDEKHDLLTEGQSYSSLDEEGNLVAQSL